MSQRIDFKNYIASKTELDSEVIDELFKNYDDEFQIARILEDRYGFKKDFLGKIWGDYLGFAYVEPRNSIVNKSYLKEVGKGFLRANSEIGRASCRERV